MNSEIEKTLRIVESKCPSILVWVDLMLTRGASQKIFSSPEYCRIVTQLDFLESFVDFGGIVRAECGGGCVAEIAVIRICESCEIQVLFWNGYGLVGWNTIL